jgi:NAD+ synthase
MEKSWQLTEKYLIYFLQNEVYKSGITSSVIGLSGGIDSAVVAVLCKKAFGSNVLAVLMPSQFSNQSSIDDAINLCKEFDIEYKLHPIECILNSYFEEFDDKVRVGNFSARVRMSILYDISAKIKALVIGTSNKSELLLGYGTAFGDLASAVNPIGDIYKSEIFQFASYLKLPKEIISKPPSADLYEGQSDENELGFSYDKIDAFLKLYVDDRLDLDTIYKMGFSKELVESMTKRIYQNQFKRKPPIIAKLTERTINQDFLYPRDIKL